MHLIRRCVSARRLIITLFSLSLLHILSSVLFLSFFRWVDVCLTEFTFFDCATTTCEIDNFIEKCISFWLYYLRIAVDEKPVWRRFFLSSCLDFLMFGRAMHLLPFSILWNQVVNFIDFGQNHFDTFYCFFSEEVSHRNRSPFWLIKLLRFKNKRKRTTNTFTFSISLDGQYHQ